MSGKDRRKKVIKALNHDFRKKLLERIADGPVTYTDLLKISDVESGYLAYHIRMMADLLEKNHEGYTLSPLGVEAISILHGRVETQQSKVTWPRLTAATLIAVILVSMVYYAYVGVMENRVVEARMQKRQALLYQTYQTMELIVSAFEYADLPRTIWADILVQASLLRRDMEAMQLEGDPLVSAPLIRGLDYFLDEATRTLSGSDEDYLAMSRENRQLLRDIHYSLFTLKRNLEESL